MFSCRFSCLRYTIIFLLFDRPECLIKHFDNFAEQTERNGVARPTVVDNFLKKEKKEEGKETSSR